MRANYRNAMKSGQFRLARLRREEADGGGENAGASVSRGHVRLALRSLVVWRAHFLLPHSEALGVQHERERGEGDVVFGTAMRDRSAAGITELGCGVVARLNSWKLALIHEALDSRAQMVDFPI